MKSPWLHPMWCRREWREQGVGFHPLVSCCRLQGELRSSSLVERDVTQMASILGVPNTMVLCCRMQEFCHHLCKEDCVLDLTFYQNGSTGRLGIREDGFRWILIHF